MQRTFQSWAHGNSVLLERANARFAVSKGTALAAFGGDRHTGDLLGTGDYGAAACFRVGWAARFVMIDVGSGDAPKSGGFWVHYPIPVPIYTDFPTKVRRVLVNYRTDTIRELSIGAVHVWDGNRRIFARDDVPRSGGDFDGNIPTTQDTLDPAPSTAQLLRLDVGDARVFFGLGVSLHIEAMTAHNAFIEIRGVGLEMVSEDRT